MEKAVRSWTLGELANLLGGDLHGDADLRIRVPAAAGEGGKDALTFASEPKYLALIEGSAVGATLVAPGMESSKPHIVVPSPRIAFGKFLHRCVRPLPLAEGIHPTAVVDPGATIGEGVRIGPYVIVERGATIGPRSRLYAHCYVGEDCHLGAEVVLYPQVVLYQDVSLGDRTVIHASTIIGADGFGYAWDGQRQLKIPQVGRVEIGEDCEIGALCAIDRAAITRTSIGADTKIDNLVQIGHNSTIGSHTVIASQSGVSGSCTVGDRVTIAGQVGLGDHVTVVDDVTMAARAASTADLTEPGLYKGYPARPVTKDLRIQAHLERLPDLAKQVKALEKRIAELESR